MMKHDLTVIVPTYNNHDSIGRCIESIMKNHSNIEIIVIDDGSTDDISFILDDFKNVKYIRNEKNMGVSYSRNVGLENVNSDYFTFVDADDYVEDNSFDFLLKKCYEYDLDICGYNYFKDKNGKKKKSRYLYEEYLLNKDQLIDLMLTDKVSLVIWDKIYKYATFKGIQFNESLLINEDYDYSIKCFQKSKRTMFFNVYFYNYCDNSKSLTNNYLCEEIINNNYYYSLDKTNLVCNNNFAYFDCCQSVKFMHLFLQCKDKKNRYNFLKKNVDRLKVKNLLDYDISFRLKLEVYLYLFNIRVYIAFFDIYRFVFQNF